MNIAHQLDGNVIQLIQNNISCIVAAALTHIGDKNRTGGFLCLTTHDGIVLMQMLVGKLSDPVKADKYRRLSLEKCERLARNPDHLSCWPTRNTSDEMYGGAVRGNTMLLGFSGFPELYDESCMLAFGEQMGELEPSRIIYIASTSKNETAKIMLSHIPFEWDAPTAAFRG